MEQEKTPEQQLRDAIAEQTEGTSQHNVFVLEFNNIHFKRFTWEIKQLIERYREVQFLSLINCDLESLENFPVLPHLIRLDLVSNSITEDSLQYLQNSRQLQTIILSHNEINSLETLNHFQQFKSLIYLDLFGNPVQEALDDKDYKKQVFQTLKQLKILDSEDKYGKFAEEKSDEILQRVASNLLEVKKPTKAQVNVIKRISKTLVQQNNVVQKAIVQRQESQANVEEQELKPVKQKKLPKAVPKKQQYTAQYNEEHKLAERKMPVQRSTPAAEPRVSAKRNSAGKGKSSSFQKKTSDSQKSGLTFPCGRIGRYLKQQNKAHRISKYSKVYMGGILEYLCAEVVELAGIAAKENRKKRILPKHIRMAMRGDEEISKFVSNTVISEGGGVQTNNTIKVQRYLFGQTKLDKLKINNRNFYL